MERFAIKIDKKLKANLYKICRLCGIDNPDMVPILTDQPEDKKETAIDVEAELEMSQKITLLLGLTITKDDRMPQTMCCLCVDKINDFYEFREMCYATNAQTRKLLGLKDVVKKPVVDFKTKVEIKEESIVPTPISSTANNKNANRKRKTEEIKEEIPLTPAVLPKKKLRYSGASEPAVKEEPPVITKKKLRFTAMNEEVSIPATTSSSAKKSKNSATLDESKLKKEPSPPVPAAAPPAVSNKKLRLAIPPQKELANKKSKQKGGKGTESEVKEEIKEEIKEEPLAATPTPAPAAKVPPGPKLKFGCTICKERFAAKVNLDAHVRTSHIPKVERYVCTACNEVLSKSFDIKNHQLWHKLSKTPYVCGCCGESILNTYAFSRHLREHGFETPPALLVLDRECPQCHTSYATNYLYNIHICAVKTKRCAGCNRLQRNEAEYLKHSAHCAKVYLNYSKHIMPSVEALEDAVRIKNENDVEAAAEEMARISGVPLDMSPVVQLTRLSSPLIMAANQCVSLSGLDDAASTSSKKSGKKGVSKKDLKRVDELLKSTLDALVSIKHEPEVHVDPETPCAGVHSDNDEHTEAQEDAGADDGVGGLDDFHHNDNDTDDEHDQEANAVAASEIETSIEQIKIKQEIDDTNEENANKMAAGGGLKLKIKKEHGQLNSSLIEQSEKKAEKRKKKKKHKDKEKDKQKLSKDVQDEHLSQDSPANNPDVNIEHPVIRIKSEPQDDSDVGGSISMASSLPIRPPQPEATIMTSIPMMQFQIACVSSGVEFNNGAAGSLADISQTVPTVPTINHDIEPEDVKPNREELDRMLKISHVSSGIAMETDETEQETQEQPMDHDGNDNAEDEANEVDHQANNDENVAEQDDVETDFEEEEQEDEEDIEKKQKNIISKKLKKPIMKPKSKSPLKTNDNTTPSTNAKSRNKACKSTAKPSTMPVLQISAVCSGVSLEPTEPSASEFTPIFIKPEPLNRGYADEQAAPALEAPLPSPPLPAPEIPEEEQEELPQTHTAEEQEYISSIDFNNITIKQEKDIEISDVQITQKSIKTFTEINGIKRKRKTARRSQTSKDKKALENHEKLENNDEPAENEEDDEQETDEEIAEEHDEDEDAEEEEEEEEEDEEEAEEEEEIEEEEEEEREYRELEYPPQLEDKNDTGGVEEKVETKQTDVTNNIPNESQENANLKENNHDSTTAVVAPAFVISSVCSQANLSSSDNLEKPTNDLENTKLNVDNIEVLANNDHNILTPASESDKNSDIISQTPGLGLEIVSTTSLSQAILDPHPQLPKLVEDSSITDAAQTENTQLLAPTIMPNDALKDNVPTNEISLQLGQPFEIKLAEELQTQALDPRQETLSTDATLTEQTEGSIHNTNPQLSINQETPALLMHSLENIEEECKQQVPQLQDENLQNTLEQLAPPALSETLNTNPNLEQQKTQQNLPEPVFTISSVTSAVDINLTPQINNIPTSNNQEQELLKDNQQEQEMAVIEGVVEQAKELNSEAQPVTYNLPEHETEEDEMEEDELEEDEEDINNTEPSTTVDNNLEERQNYQNQEVLSHIRPAALALHPYLEDISSSSNSLLSNSLSQTPPPPQTQAHLTSISTDSQRLLNTEETENILNESSDMLGGQRSSERATTSTAPAAHLGQQLPTHMPTFNFDNINEIAENNNNANIEREQLQDEQQQQNQQSTTTTNNQ